MRTAEQIARRSRRLASQAIDIPVRSTATVGRGAKLFASVLRYIFFGFRRLPFAETWTQGWALLKVTSIPAMLMAIPFGAMVSVQVSGLINQVGATSLVGAASAVGVIRQGAPITAGLLMGGAAASAIASDIGARAIREELDALRVMGIDPVQNLVVPRFLGLLIIAPMLCSIIITSAVGAAFGMAVKFNDVAMGSFWQSFGTFSSTTDIWFAIGKTIVFAMIVATISSLRGMEAKGGPRGVADAVNSSVVLNTIAIIIANLAITQLQVMFFPMEVS
ncbi:MlaE family ABC transporter permease [Mycobacterium syngnathidarum]